MQDDVLDVERVKQMRVDRGVTVRWLIKHVGLSETRGYVMFRKGLLPEDRAERKAVLEKIASYFGVGVPQILLHLEAKRAC